MSEVAPSNSANYPAIGLGVLFTLLLIAGIGMESMGLGGIDYAYLTGQTLVVWLISKGIVMSIIRGKPPSTQAIGRVVVGGVVFLWVAGVCGSNWYENLQVRGALRNLADASNTLGTQPTTTSQPTRPMAAETPLSASAPSIETDKVSLARFMNEMASLVRAQREDYDKLEERIKRLQMDTVLAPETLIDRDKIAQARITTQQFLGLITERAVLVANQWAADEAKLKTIPNDDERRRALNPFYKNKAKFMPLFQQRDDVQREFAEIMLALLEWSDSNVGNTIASKGQILFQNQELLGHYNNYLRRLQALEEKEARLDQAIADAEQVRQKEVQQFLGKAGIR